MSYIVLGVCVILAFSIHELGHAFAMRKHAISLKEVTLLGVGPKLLEFRLLRFFGNTPICIRLLPIGAFGPMPDMTGLSTMANLTYLARNEIYGAGIIANIAFAIVLTGISLLVMVASAVDHSIATILVTSVLILCLATLLCWGMTRYGKWITISFPFIGAGLLLWCLTLNWSPSDVSSMGTIATASTFIGLAKQYQDGLMLGVLFSVGLVAINLLPFLPLDGGCLVGNLIRKCVGEARYTRVKTATIIALLVPGVLLIGLAVVGDLSSVFIR